MGVRRKGGRYAYAIISIATFSYTCLTFVWFSLSVYLTTIIEEVNLTSTEAGLLVGPIPLTYIPLSLITGIVIDRVGPGRSLAMGVLIIGVGQIGRSTAPNFWLLLLYTFLIGVGATAVTFGVPKLVSFLFLPKETGLPSSIYLVGSTIGSALVFGVGRSVLGPWLGGWRPFFLWSGRVAVGFAIIWFFVTRLVNIDAQATEYDSTFSLTSITNDLKLILLHRELQLIVVIGTMYLLINHGIQGWLPTFLKTRGFSNDMAGHTTSLYVVAFATGISIVPMLADRFNSRRTALIVCGTVIFFGVSGIVVESLVFLLFTSIIITGVGVGGISPLMRAMPPELDSIGAQHTGTAVAYIFAVGEIGGFLGPVLIGILYGATGSYIPGITVLGLAGLIIAVTATILRWIQ
jgi:cyanate permease